MTSSRDVLFFIGVSTSGSSIMRLFPLWAELLGLDAGIEGHDVPLGAPPERFRAAVREVAERPEVRGALVTTHKVDVYQHAGDLFDELDRYARICGEVSCVAKRGGRLVGHAKDPITAGQAIEDMVGRDWFRERPAHALCLGAGGAGIALTLYLLALEHPPARVVLTDVDPARLAAAQRAHAHLGARVPVDYHLVAGPEDGDRLVAQLPAGSLVVNATGMGKDRPGSPLSDRACFPRQGVAWDLNYRGELRFLAQALAQASERELAVHDGWRYFLHGWVEVIAEVFALEVTRERFADLARAAEPLRPRLLDTP